MDRQEIINAVQHMQDYIERHITEPITLNSLAKAACYSIQRIRNGKYHMKISDIQ